MTLDMSRIPGFKIGHCTDIWCDTPEEPTTVTYVHYIASNKGPAWLCGECLELWSDELESYCDNMVDLDLPEAFPMIP